MTIARKNSIASLQDALDRITQKTRALVQPERLITSERSTAKLFASGIEQHVLPVNAPAPEFGLPDALTGKLVRSIDLLALGPLVIKFFRGGWCAYCTTELETWRDLHQELRSLEGLFVAISPQTRRQNDLLVQQHRLPFPVLADCGTTVAEQFGIAYTVPEEDRSYYKAILVNLPFVNSGKTYKDAIEADWRLPLPATFIVRQDGTIGYSTAYADFRLRPEPAEVLSALASL